MRQDEEDDIKGVPLEKRNRYTDDPTYLKKHRKWTTFLCNVGDGQCLGRTAFRWFLLFIFYVAFFSSLAVLWTICYLVFSSTLDVKKPRWFLPQPGLSFQPSMQDRQQPEITYAYNNDDDVERILFHMGNTIEKHGPLLKGRFGSCSTEDFYGYTTRKPCIYLKINKILNYKAETYTKTNELPKFAPQSLRSYMKNMTAAERSKKIWLSCETKPHIELEYIPHPYVGVQHVQFNAAQEHPEYASTTQKGAKDSSRIIAVRPKKDLPLNKMHAIRCYVFAKNIIIEKHPTMARGNIVFKVQVEYDTTKASHKKM